MYKRQVYHTGNAGASLSAVCTYKYGEYAVPQQDATFDIVIPKMCIRDRSLTPAMREHS